MNIKSNRLYRISFWHHIIFWSVYFLFNTFRWGSYFDDYLYSLKTNLLGFPIHIALCYFNIYFLMPKFLFKKKYVPFVILILSAIFLMVLAKFNLTYFLISSEVWPEGPNPINNLTLNYVIDMMIGELYVITFVTAIKVTLDFLKEHKRVADLEKAQLETELLFLKSQISPHFFFNTLNNIHSLALEKSNKTSKIILRLSELMRYLLYETKSERQSLENEIMCIQNYLDLEKIRHDDLLKVQMCISGDIHDKTIAPILLLTFVENAFKHGVSKNIGLVNVDIEFVVEGDFLYFTITNPLPSAHTLTHELNQSSGIGLENVKKRLSLGYDKEDYELTIKSDAETFTIHLKIKVTA
ncbi:sensor histidine kinase [Gelidibacter salicanalis]|uniref:Sensor histidine kinase n=1 Tax=Gelidibacter salicanalis TaxID=291193 RepID=A0A5C7ATD8_9FLAO|nr:histidine kinase [Gelidibacter salicanalis]TXE09112.1 sensor histidine kinase [Gelidibacter salicanalis]